jgi:hypothetical protein
MLSTRFLRTPMESYRTRFSVDGPGAQDSARAKDWGADSEPKAFGPKRAPTASWARYHAAK